MTPGLWLDPENTAKTSIQTGLLTHQTTIGRGHCLNFAPRLPNRSQRPHCSMFP
jgi:hypothetical protein